MFMVIFDEVISITTYTLEGGECRLLKDKYICK